MAAPARPHYAVPMPRPNSPRPGKPGPPAARGGHQPASARPPAAKPAAAKPPRGAPSGKPSRGAPPAKPARGAFPGKLPQGAPPARPARTFAPAKARPPAPPSRPDAARPAPHRPPPTPTTAPAPHATAAPPAPVASPRATRDAPRGTVWLHGQHAVAAALANPARQHRRLLLTEEAHAALSARLPLPWAMAPERTERHRLDALLGRDVVHQGIALLSDLLPPPGLAETLERPGPVLVLDQVTDPRNVGAILRSAAAFGACCVVVQDRNAPEETGALAKAASGALETVPLLRAVNLARTLGALKTAGLWVIGLDAGGTSLDGRALAERRIALVLGAEGAGLRRLTRDSCDEVAGLAMPGGMESLNVSAAAAVALYEVGRK